MQSSALTKSPTMQVHEKTRITLLYFFFFFVGGVLIINLFFIQIINGLFFKQLAHQQYTLKVNSYHPRAPIVDRHGRYLAMNKESIAAFIMPNNVKAADELQQFLGIHFPNSLEQLHKKRHKSFMYIKRKLSDKEQELLRLASLPDIHFLHTSSRFYPVPSASPLIGMTDIDNRGLSGVELSCNDQLMGKPVTQTLEKDARSGYFYFTQKMEDSGTIGNQIQLTIDSNLQFLVDEELKKTMQHFQATQGAVIVMNPDNGEILAMVCRPYVDHEVTSSFDVAHTKNQLISESYELGSVFKLFTALAALEEGVVDPDEMIDCKNSTTTIIDGRVINTVKAHDKIPFKDVVAVSNNIGIAQVAKRLGPLLHTHYRRLGFGAKTGIALPGEQAGFVNPPDQWSKQSIISLSYGYEVTATLLQLACAMSIVARDGYAINPIIFLSNDGAQQNNARLYSPKSIELIKEILTNTTRYGTGQKAQIKGYRIMSKTGTANLLVDGQYNHEKNIYTCAAILEKDHYKRVIVTFIKEAHGHNLYASTVAVPLLEKVAEKIIIHERII